jgi:hypothetical protein
MSKSTVNGGSIGKWSEYFHEMAGVVCAIAIVQQKKTVSNSIPAFLNSIRIMF